MGQGSFQHACSVLEATLISSTVFETAEKQYSFQCSSGILLEALEFMALPTSWSAFPCTVHGGEPCSISAGVQSAWQASGEHGRSLRLDSETFDSQADHMVCKSFLHHILLSPVTAPCLALPRGVVHKQL
ncbi:unnamed protein product [Effrenium voratum]|uniref:Uncharacterized protein n=1 Tax=Effrenium voratum TaxID=2562239 RepID=A0AA36MM86_9DINO|nr:unnamed protein product [Effrenium voratum]CAJ1417024.1 unnamed protein product [Effrenium voratum]